MKTMKYLSMMLLMVVTSVCLCGCGDDDELQPISSDNIIGVWEVQGGNPNNITTYEFRNDGTGVITDASGTVNIRYTYSVTSSSKTLKLWAVNDDTIYNYSVQQTGNILMLTSGGTTLVLERKK